MFQAILLSLLAAQAGPGNEAEKLYRDLEVKVAAARAVKVAAAGGRRRRAGFHSVIRREVPIRTFNDWKDPVPGLTLVKFRFSRRLMIGQGDAASTRVTTGGSAGLWNIRSIPITAARSRRVSALKFRRRWPASR